MAIDIRQQLVARQIAWIDRAARRTLGGAPERTITVERVPGTEAKIDQRQKRIGVPAPHPISEGLPNLPAVLGTLIPIDSIDGSSSFCQRVQRLAIACRQIVERRLEPGRGILVEQAANQLRGGAIGLSWRHGDDSQVD